MSSPVRPVPQRRPLRHGPTRKQIILRRVVALTVVVVVLGIAALLVITGMGSSGSSGSIRDYADAWARGDARAMYALITPASQSEFTQNEFAQLVKRARDTSTTRTIAIDDVRDNDNGSWQVRSKVTTRAFGVIDAPLRLPVEGSGDDARVKFAPDLVFPGMPEGAERLARDTELPTRADLLARDGTTLASGESRSSPVPEVADEVVGSLGSIPDGRRDYYYSRGFPDDAQVGTSGLERILQSKLAGTPGGTLRAAGQTIASSQPKRARTVRSTISIGIERAAFQAIAGRVGGVVAIEPKTGEVLAFAGIAFSGLQPPGSTFKIVTLAGALEAGIASPDDSYPETQSVKLSGVEFQNADRELCGGTLTQSFAKSCNSVFGPLGAKLGAEKLSAIAERFGFDKPTGVPGAAVSRFPERSALDDDLALGSAAIGQNTAQATALQMALVSSTIALGGRRPTLTFDMRGRGRRAATTRVVSPEVARQVERMMIASVAEGTGINAAIPGIEVAGKTGTAELTATQECDPTKPPIPTSTTTTQTTTTPTGPDAPCPEPTDKDTTAWFTAYAPAGSPRIAVAVLITAGGQGRDSAAPAAKTVMDAALH